MSQKISLLDSVYQGYKTDTGLIVPSVILLGRDSETRKKVAFRKIFYPYVMIDDKAWSDDLFNLNAFGVKEVNYNALPGMSGQAIRRFTVKSPKNAENLERYFQKVFRTRTYESDLMRTESLGLKFLIDSGIKSGFEWLDGVITPSNDTYVPLRIWFGDTEVMSSSTGKINPYRDEAVCLWTHHDNYDDVYKTFYFHDKTFKPIFPNHIGVKCINEPDLLNKVLEEMDLKNPDTVAMHNSERFDIPKFIGRCQKFGIDVNRLSPKPFRHVDTKTFPARISGRFFLDTLKALIFFTNKELGRYSLEYIIETEKLPIIKVEMPYSTTDLWNDLPHVEQSFVELYDSLKDEAKKYFIDAGISREEFRPSYIMWLRNVLDVKALQLLEEKENIIRAFDSLRRSNGGLMEDIYIRNKIIDTRLLRMCSNICVLPSTNRLGGKKEKTGGFPGGYVHDPIVGLHDLVGLLDFKRQYPNIMVSLNISSDTYVDLNMFTVEQATIEAKKRNLYLIIAHDGKTMYAFKKSPPGLIPRMLLQLMAERAEYEEEEKKALKAGNRMLAADFKYKAWYTKVTLDGTFGVLGWTGFRLYNLPSSAVIPCVGQYATIEAIRFMLEDLEEAIQTLYADTDSSFFKMLETMTLEDAQNLVKKINEHLGEWAFKKWGVTRNPFNFALKRIYSQLLLMTKKQYIGMYEWDEKKGWLEKPEFDYKGTAAIKSDASTFEKYVLKTIFELCLKSEGEKQIIKIYKEQLSQISAHTLVPHDISYPTKLKKPFNWNQDMDIWQYKGKPSRNKKAKKVTMTVPAHIKTAIYSNMFLGESWRQGDKPSRLPIDKKKIRSHPTKFSIMMRNGQTKEYILNAIAIDESSVIPEEFIKAINWNKIRSRLEKKISAVFNAMNIKTSDNNTIDMYFG